MLRRTMNKKVQKFCFTLNNYTEDEFKKIGEYMLKNAVYGIVGREIGELGTPHLQGYINLV
jgi:Putative viral replication protein